MLAVTLLLGLWIGWQESPREIGRWYLAAAVEHRTNADYSRIMGRHEAAERYRRRAAEAMSKALSWHPGSGETYLERARWRRQDQHYREALSDCEAALRLGISAVAVADVKAELLVHLGKPTEAIAEAERIHVHLSRNWTPQDDFIGLNARAYFRSLAKEQLPEALADIDAALRLVPSPDAGILDTRGWVLYQMGRHEEAMGVFQQALGLAETELVVRKSARPSIRTLDVREFEIANERQIQSMAVIYYHASRVLEKLGRWKEAKELRAKAKELLGREPDDSVF